MSALAARPRFLRAWLSGYRSPSRSVDALTGAPAPRWGVAGQGLRALLDGLLLYLPLTLLGRQPSQPSALTFIPTADYYAWSVVLQPLFLMLQWLLLAALAHVVLRLAGYPSDVDLILNITGMVALVVGAFLLAWDWLYLLAGGRSDVLLGVTHLLADLWGIVLTVAALRRLLGLPLWLALALNVLWLAVGVPLAMLFARAPV